MKTPTYTVLVEFEAEVRFDFDPAELDADQLEAIGELTPDRIKDWLCEELEADPTCFGEVEIGSIKELTLKQAK